MIDRDYFNDLLTFDRILGEKKCANKYVKDYPKVLSEMYYRQMLLANSFMEWEAEKGIGWLLGFANYINQNNGYKHNDILLRRKYNFGEIIDVDFFGSFTNELTFDHPAVVLKNFSTGLLIAPITSNETVYVEADDNPTHIKLPKGALPFGYMLLNSTIKLEQTRYISKERVLRLREREKQNRQGTTRIIQQRITDSVKQTEIKRALMFIFSASLVYDLEGKIDELSEYKNQYELLKAEHDSLIGVNLALEEENIRLKEQLEEVSNR